MNMNTPVGSIALDMPFHDAIMLYFCLAVNGSRGSGGPGLGGSSSLSLCLPPRSSPDPAELASLPRSQPIRVQCDSPPRWGEGLPVYERSVAAGSSLRVHPRVVVIACCGTALPVHSAYNTYRQTHCRPCRAYTCMTPVATASRSSGRNTRTALPPMFSPTKRTETVAAPQTATATHTHAAPVHTHPCIRVRAHTHHARSSPPPSLPRPPAQ